MKLTERFNNKINEVGSNDDLEQAISRADKMYKRNMGSRELISFVTRSYTDRVILQFVDKYQDKLRKRAKEEVGLVDREIKEHLATLKRHPELQK